MRIKKSELKSLIENFLFEEEEPDQEKDDKQESDKKEEEDKQASDEEKEDVAKPETPEQFAAELAAGKKAVFTEPVAKALGKNLSGKVGEKYDAEDLDPNIANILRTYSTKQA